MGPDWFLWIETILSSLRWRIKDLGLVSLLLWDIILLFWFVFAKATHREITRRYRLTLLIAMVHLAVGGVFLLFGILGAYEAITFVCYGAILFVLLSKRFDDSPTMVDDMGGTSGSASKTASPETGSASLIQGEALDQENAEMASGSKDLPKPRQGPFDP